MLTPRSTNCRIVVFVPVSRITSRTSQRSKDRRITNMPKINRKRKSAESITSTLFFSRNLCTFPCSGAYCGSVRDQAPYAAGTPRLKVHAQPRKSAKIVFQFLLVKIGNPTRVRRCALAVRGRLRDRAFYFMYKRSCSSSICFSKSSISFTSRFRCWICSTV